MQYLGSDDAGVSSFSLQDFEPSFGSKMNAAVRESWLESYGPVAMDYAVSKFGAADTKRITAAEALDYAKNYGGGVKLNLTPKDGQYTIGQWSTIIERQRELAAVKDVRDRTEFGWLNPGSWARGAAMFGAGIVDPINLATAFVPWTRLVGAARGLQAAAMAESALTRFGARAALGGIDAGISTAALEPLNYYARNELGDDYTAMDSMANIAFGTAFGGGLHAIGGVGVDAWKAYRARNAVAPAVMTPELAAAAKTMTPEERVQAGIAPEAARAGMPEVVEPVAKRADPTDPLAPLTPEEMAAYTGKTYNPTPTLNDVYTPTARQTPDSPVQPTPEPKPEKRRDLLDALKNNGGLSPTLARDAGGENGMRLNRKLPGVVKKTGLTEYDQVAEVLGEQGFLRPGTEPGSQDAIDQAQELVARAFNGESVLRWEDAITAAEKRQAMDYQDYLDSLRTNDAPAYEVAGILDPETREATLRASVAQAVDGRNVDVDAIVGMDESLQTHTTADAIAAADRNFSPAEVATADVEAAANVQARIDSAPKWESVAEAEAALAEADTVLTDTVKAGEDAFKYSRAYHGTPHRFDKFTTDKMGTGEGAQAYGWGLYFASEKDIAEWYRNTLAGDGFLVGDGQVFDPSTLKHLNIKNAARKGDLDAAIAKAKEISQSDSPVANLAAEDLAVLEDIKARGGITKNTGQLYEVNIPEDSQMLLWDKPLSEQPEAVRKGLAELDSDMYDPEGGDYDASEQGQIIYQRLQSRLGSDRAASEFLATLGIKGIKYLDGTSRAAGDGSFNYVVFSGDDVDITATFYARGFTAKSAVDALTNSVRASFGKSTDAMLESGRIKVVGTVNEIPGWPHPQDVKGATAPDGTVYIVAENVSEAEARGMVLHEVGVHAGMENMLGTEVFQSVLAELDDAIARGESWAQAARDRVPSATIEAHIREEQLAYLVQNSPELPLVQRIIAAVRAWAYRTFEFAREGMTLTEADFRAMAVAALHDAARDGGRRSGFAYGRTPTDVKSSEWLPAALGEKKMVLEAFKDGVSAGKATIYKLPDGEILISDIKTESKFAKQGVATELTNEIFRKTGAAMLRFSGGTTADGTAFFTKYGEKMVDGRRAVMRPADIDGAAKYSRGPEQDPSTTADELKPYDDAIARAKQYAGVLRAAADKLDNDAQATAAMRAAMPDITPQEINDLLGGLRKQVKGLRGMARTARTAVTAENTATMMQSDAMKAADTLANNLSMAAVIEKRNAALNINARMKASAYINQFRAAGLDFEGFRGLLVGTERKRAGGRISVDAEQKNFRGEWLGGMIADLEQAGLMKAFASGEFDRDVYVALYNLGRDGKGNENLPTEAVKIAEVVNKYQTDARNTRNRFGAWIRDLNGYITRQSHDMLKIREAGEPKYKQDVLPLLDVERSMRDFDGSVDDFLTRVYDDFAAGSHMKAAAGEDDIQALGRGSSLAKKESQSRVLYFKDGAAAYEYNQKYGQGRLAESVLQGLDHAAKSAGLLKLLGTNPEATVSRLFDEYAESLRGDPARRAKFLSYRKELENLLSHVDGSVNIPGNATAAKVAAFARAWISMSKLGGMLLSSVTDLANYAAELRFAQDSNLLSGTLDGIGSLVKGRSAGEKRAILNSLGVFHESTLGSVFARFDSPDLIGGKTSAAMQTFFKLSGINWWTESLRDGYALTHAAYMSSQAGKTFDKIDASLRDMLGLYNIDAGKWEILRQANTHQADGRTYITPEGLRTVPRKTLEAYITSVGRTANDAAVQNLRDDLSAALRTMTIDRMHHAVIEPGARTRAFMLRGTQPGTVPGELLRFVTQFKSFPVALIQGTLGREVYGRGYDTLGQYLKNGKGDMLGLASFIALSTAMGYAAMSAKDLLRGKNPRPIDDWRTWQAAMVQGGGLGIYGDFLFGKYNRMGGTLSGSLMGPMAGVVDTAADLWTRIRNGDDVAAASFKAVLDNTPFMNLFYTRTALDYLILFQIQEALNPGFLRRMERRAATENGQTYFLPPTAVVN